MHCSLTGSSVAQAALAAFCWHQVSFPKCSGWFLFLHCDLGFLKKGKSGKRTKKGGRKEGRKGGGKGRRKGGGREGGRERGRREGEKREKGGIKRSEKGWERRREGRRGEEGIR